MSAVPGAAGSVARTNDGKVLVFRVGSQQCALPIGAVREIVSNVEVTSLPDPAAAAEGWVGVMNLRGQIVAVLDLRVRLQRDHAAAGPRILVVAECVTPAGVQVIGLAVDAVDEVLEVGPDRWRPVPGVCGAHEGVLGLVETGDRILVLLDVPFLAAAGRPQEVRSRSAR